MSTLVPYVTIETERRKNVIHLLNFFCEDILVSREIESSIHSISGSIEEYINRAQQIVLNLKNNRDLKKYGKNIITKTDSEMSKGTILEDIERESLLQKIRFEQMLQEKYDMLNDKSYNATLKCRRCGSAEVSWEQKQTRSADEASTVFCTCNKCNNRWTMR
tara:strand:- start:179 stop:664 length:486 start_codon:yes stop_codon:yes gene_type:complete